MEEQKENKGRENDLSFEQKALIIKQIKSNRFKIIMDIILVIVLLSLLFYCYSEIDTFKKLNEDVCRMCEEKTGGNCVLGNYIIPKDNSQKIILDLDKFKENP